MRRVNVFLYLGIIFTMGALGFFFISKYDLIKSSTKEALDESRSDSGKLPHQNLEVLASIASGNMGSTQEEMNEALFYIGEIYEKMNMPEIAKKKYIQVLKRISPSTPEWKDKLQFKIAKIKIMTLYNDEALIRLLLLAKKTHDRYFRSEIYTELGRLYLTTRKVNKAINSLRAALQENPDNEEARKLLSKIKQSPKNDCEVKENINSSCKKKPETITKINEIKEGNEKDENKNNEQKRKDILKIAFGYYGQHDYEAAIQFFNKIAHCCPDTPEAEIALFYTGSAYAMLENYPEAIKAHKRVLGNSISARNQLSMIRIGQLYFKKEDFKKAAHYFKMSQKRYSDGKYLEIAKEWEEEAVKFQEDKEQYVN